jgi:hypothetical protein
VARSQGATLRNKIANFHREKLRVRMGSTCQLRIYAKISKQGDPAFSLVSSLSLVELPVQSKFNQALENGHLTLFFHMLMLEGLSSCSYSSQEEEPFSPLQEPCLSEQE